MFSNWSWGAFSFPIVFWLFSFFLSARDGTLTRRRFKTVTMGFLNHGGMWSDLLILSLVNGLVVPHLRTGMAWWIGCFLISFFVTMCAHWLWWVSMGAKGQTTHIFPVYTEVGWVVDLSAAGALHVFYVVPQLAILLMYLVSRGVPAPVVGATVVFLTAHIVFAVGQPGVFCDRRVTPETGWTGIVLLTLVWIPGGLLKFLKAM